MYAIHTLAPRAQIYVFLYNCIQIYKICQSFIKVFYYTKVTILPALFTNPYCIAGLLHTKRERKQFCHSHSLSQRYLIYFTLFTSKIHLSDHSYFNTPSTAANCASTSSETVPSTSSIVYAYSLRLLFVITSIFIFFSAKRAVNCPIIFGIFL